MQFVGENRRTHEGHIHFLRKAGKAELHLPPGHMHPLTSRSPKLPRTKIVVSNWGGSADSHPGELNQQNHLLKSKYTWLGATPFSAFFFEIMTWTNKSLATAKYTIYSTVCYFCLDLVLLWRSEVFSDFPKCMRIRTNEKKPLFIASCECMATSTWTTHTRLEEGRMPIEMDLAWCDTQCATGGSSQLHAQ